MRLEHVDIGEICFYTPRELAALFASADDTLRPIIAIGGLAGLRTEELLRLDWADVWRRERHIELTGLIAKGRFRRLVETGEEKAEPSGWRVVCGAGRSSLGWVTHSKRIPAHA
jgi:integrase